MILIEDAREIPDVLWTGVSSFERLAVPKNYEEFLVKNSFPAKMFIEGDKTLLVAGIYQETLLGTRRFWALISPELAGAKVSSLRTLREYGNEILPGSETYVLGNEKPAVRLAEFFGFHSTGNYLVMEHKVYEVYRRPA